MTNQKVNIEIEDFEDKKSANGRRYTRFKTSQGWMSAFEKEIIDSLKENEGKTICVEIAIDEEKGFKNIRKFCGEAQKIETIKPSEFGRAAPIVKDTTTMYVSYAKDIFCEMIKQPNVDSENKKMNSVQIMEVAINLVNQAKKSFENGTTNTDNKQE